MPGARAPGQKLINLPASEEFIELIEANLRKCGYTNRAEFIRDAIVEKLEQQQIKVPAGINLAPSRAGKGGRKKVSSSSAAFDSVRAIVGNGGKTSAAHLAAEQLIAQKSKPQAGARHQSKSRPGGPGRAPK